MIRRKSSGRDTWAIFSSEKGYAAATDTGHRDDGYAWAIGHPEKVIDWDIAPCTNSCCFQPSQFYLPRMWPVFGRETITDFSICDDSNIGFGNPISIGQVAYCL